MADPGNEPGLSGPLYYVMRELERLGHEITGLRKDVRDLREDMVMLKVKSGLWGSGAGILAAALVQVIFKAVLAK